MVCRFGVQIPKTSTTLDIGIIVTQASSPFDLHFFVNMVSQNRAQRKLNAFTALFFIATAVSTTVHISSSLEAKTSRSTALDSAPYRDARLPIDKRVEDLIKRMTIEEKAGQLFQNMASTRYEHN
jgi:hypothetical protein